jgi:heme exporter protein A
VKSYGRRRALDGVDVDLAAGERLAIVGPNGAGKTTLLRMLATLHRPDAGTLTVLGEPLPERAAEARARLGYLGHDPLVYLDLTPLQNLELFAALYGVRDPNRRIESLLDQVGLLTRAFEPVRTFSRGMAQRLGLARLMLHEPELLLLDEPHAGLDAPGTALLDGLLAPGSSAVLVTHDVARAVEIADRVVVLRAGRVILHRDTSEVAPDAFRAEYEAAIA